MKYGFLGHYREHSGSGKMAREYLKAMHVAGLDIASRPIKLNNSNPQVEDFITQFEANSFDNLDAIIQCVLPHHMEYVGGVKNIGLAIYECFHSKYSGWAERLNMMDEVWTSSSYSKYCLQSAGVTVPITVVPIPCDAKKYETKYERLSHPELDGNFIFYTIADFAVRKNLPTLIKAFHIAFTNNFPVKLLIKTSKHGVSGNEVEEMLRKDISKIKQGLKLYGSESKYLDEILITDDIPEHGINQIHATGDVFITASHGEAWSLPLFDAMGFGNLCIFPDITVGDIRHIEFMSDWKNAIPVDSSVDQAFGEVDTFYELYSGRESWLYTSTALLAETMQFAYHNRNTEIVSSLKENAVKTPAKYDYSVIGNQMKELLCN